MESRPLEWTAQLSYTPHQPLALPGDKIVLPPSALEQLLSAATTITVSDGPPTHSTSFDPYNPYSFGAERNARAQSQQTFQQLPHPLTFRLVNPQNGRIVYAGIREFSADEASIGLSQFLRNALGISDSPDIKQITDEDVAEEGSRVTIHAKQLPKGTFVKLRPLEAGYDPEDWKALLEQHLQKNYTTLTKGEILTMPAPRRRGSGEEKFRFLIDSFIPEGDGICVVDTDLEVDIEALNEEQARETLDRILAKTKKGPGAENGETSSRGGDLDLFREQSGQVRSGEYVDYQISSWDRSQGVEITVDKDDADDDIDLFVTPFSTRQRARPRDDEHVFGDFDNRPTKRIRISPTNVDLEDAEALWVSVHAPTSDTPQAPARHFTIRASPYDPKFTSSSERATDTSTATTPLKPGEVLCSNCHKPVPQPSLVLHQNFCLRNNILCPHGCGQVFQRRSPTYAAHWHCPHDSAHGNTPTSLNHHNHIFHTPHPCPGETDTTPCTYHASTLPDLAHHRTTTCPAKPILCQFCHLEVPQETHTDPAAALSGLTPHEVADGARTTDCHLCARPVRLRDMRAHLAVHAHERVRRPRPRVCRNVNCGRTLDGTGRMGDTRKDTRQGQGNGNAVGLCSVCFGPLYVSVHDPEGRALKRRVERRYLQQLLTGCGRAWCGNEFCRTGRGGQAVGTKEGMPLVKKFLDGLFEGDEAEGTWVTGLHFCVDEASQRRRRVAETLFAEMEAGMRAKRYGWEWCVGALEAEGGDAERARQWLENYAPSVAEEAERSA